MRKAAHPLLARVKTWLDRDWMYALILLLVMLVAYGWEIGRRGFFWDDWTVVYLNGLRSPANLWAFYSNDRPVSIWTFLLTLPVLGLHPLRWQLFTLLVRWLGSLFFISSLQRVWKEKAWQVRWMGLLLVVYPGFSQQSISISYSQHFLTFLLYAVSLWLMIEALEKARYRPFFFVFSILCAFGHIFTMEYFIGLELLRPFLLWYYFSANGTRRRKAVKRVLLTWFPYLGILAFFVIFRVAVFPGLISGPDPNTPALLLMLKDQPAAALLKVFQFMVQDSVHALVFAWLNPFSPSTIDLSSKFMLFSWAIGAATASLVVVYMSRNEKQSVILAAEGGEGAFTRQALLLGTLGLLLGGLPVWITNRQMIAGMYSDRFSLGPMIGVVILLVAALDWLGNSNLRKSIFLAVPLALALAFQVQTMNKYHTAWEVQGKYFWQVAWRIPSIQPQTVILAPEIPMSYISESSMAYGFNAFYNPNPGSFDLPYWFVSVPRRWSLEDAPALIQGEPVKWADRNLQFNVSSQQSIAIQYNPSRGCVRVLDPIYLDAPALSSYPTSEFERILIQAGDGSRILPAEKQDRTTLAEVVGSEPPHDWCYYYEKADLARQLKDWPEAVRLGDEVNQKGYKTKNFAEWVPFIEAYAHIGEWDKAVQLSKDAYQQQAGSQGILCATWERIAQQAAPEKAIVGGIESALSCQVVNN